MHAVMMVAAPMQARRDLKAPLSRPQRSGGLTALFVVLGLLGLAAIGFFLFFMSVQSTSEALPQVKESVGESKTEGVAWTVKKSNIVVEEKAPVVHEETLVLTTQHGNLRIVMRPDLSPSSVSYIRPLVQSGTCKRCNFYRAEKPGILQGIMDDPEVKVTVNKGECPPEFVNSKQDCPAHDPNCGCHGPTMTKGMVGWAGGDTGPDFFIDSYKEPAKFWGQQHTVFGEIKDDASFAVIDKIYSLPVTNKGMTYLDEKIQFTMALE